MAFQIVQVVYWLVLSTWFGGVLFIAMSAPIIFRTVRENHPILPHVLSVNLEGQHSTLLAGTIMGHLVSMLSGIELFCAAVIFLAMGAQWWIIVDLSNPASKLSAYLRSALFLAATGIVVYERWFLWPKIWKYRQEFIDNADDPEKANPVRELFDRSQRESVNLLYISVFLLLGMILFSGGLHPPTLFFTSDHG